MKSPHEDPLEPILRSWQVNPPKDPDFKERVHHRIHEHFFTHETDRESERPESVIAALLSMRTLGVSAAALLLVVTTVLVTLQFHPGTLPMGYVPESYRVVIDPAQTARSMLTGPNGFESLVDKPNLSRASFDTALHWIEKQVELEPAQMVQFQRVHLRFFDQYAGLCQQLFELENQYRQFERNRIAGQSVDLFRVHANFEQQKQIYQRTIQLQQELIREVSSVLTPQQQGAYGRLFPISPIPDSHAPPERLQNSPREWNI